MAADIIVGYCFHSQLKTGSTGLQKLTGQVNNTLTNTQFPRDGSGYRYRYIIQVSLQEKKPNNESVRTQSRQRPCVIDRARRAVQFYSRRYHRRPQIRETRRASTDSVSS